MRRFNLRAKFAVFTIVFGIIFGVIISGVVFWYLRDVLVKDRIDSIEKISTEQIHETLGNFGYYQLFAKMLGTRTRVLEYLQDQSEVRRAELDGILNDYAKEDTNILSIYLINKDGDTLISTDKTFVGQNYGFREYFKVALSGKPYVEAALGKTSNKFGYYFSYPVIAKDGVVVGVLVTKVDEGYFAKPISASELTRSNTIMMVDDLGVVMISNHPGRFLFSLGPLSESEKKGLSESNKFLGKEIKPLQYGPVKDVLKNYVSPQSVSMFDAIDNEQEILYIQKIGDLPFFLIVEMGLNDVEKAVLNVVLITSAAVLLAALLVACLGYWSVARLFVGPFRELGEATRRISLGDFSYRISINTKDELEDLADTMNTMSQKLGNYYKDLDDQVKEKTAEIEEKNKKLAEQQKVVLNILGEVKAEKIRAEVLAAIVKDADEPIIGEDLNRIITSWNHGAEKLYGYLASEVVGKPIDIIVPDDKKVELDKILKSVAAGKSVSHIQTVRKKKDGSLVEVLLSVAPVRDASGKVVGTSAIASDITKEKQIDRAKTEFVSLASHQLRTPLTAINWFAEILLNGDVGHLKPKQANYVQEIYRGNQRMVELVNALLNVSRLELGTFMIEPKLTDIRKIADEAINDLENKVLEKKIKITKKYDKRIKEMMLDDKLTMIIFQNLLSNAVKYTPENGKVDLSIAVSGSKLLISVIDNGMGIPKAQQDKIFTKLFRADNVRATDTEGTGLGLYIIKSVVESVGGKIWFESEENKGTKFFVGLPLSGMKGKKGTKSLA